MTARNPYLFAGIAWSTDRVLVQTIAHAPGDLGLAVELLPPWYDVDDEPSLRRLCRELLPDGRPRTPRVRGMAVRRPYAGVSPPPRSPGTGGHLVSAAFRAPARALTASFVSSVATASRARRIGSGAGAALAGLAVLTAASYL